MSTRPHVSRPRVQRPQVYLPIVHLVKSMYPSLCLTDSPNICLKSLLHQANQSLTRVAVMKKRHHWWIKTFLGLVLAIGCILQIQISLDKYMSVKTTLARYQRKQGKAPLPTTILCPHNPYRQSRIMEDNNMTVFTDM